MVHPLDILLSVVTTLLLVRFLPNKWIVGSFAPKTKKGQQALRKRLEKM